MNWWLRKLLASYREESGCPAPDRVKTDEDFEDPCRTCRMTDAILSDTWKPLDWQTDGPLVVEMGDDSLATIERASVGWAWRIEKPDGWSMKVMQEGTEVSLADAIYMAERAVRGF